MPYRNQLLNEGKTIYHVFEVATNRKVASFLNENYAHNCASNRSFGNLFVVVEEYPSGHTQSTVYLDGEVLNEMTLPMSDPIPKIFPLKPTTPNRPKPKPNDLWEPITPKPKPKPNDPWEPYRPIRPPAEIDRDWFTTKPKYK